MTHIDTMRKAIEALETNQYAVADAAPHADVMAYNEAITALLRAIEEAEQQNSASHDLYTDADADRPDVICDSNGQVVLSLCKRCGKGEAQLYEHHCTGEQAERQSALNAMADNACELGLDYTTPLNLTDKSVQKRLATQWGYATEQQEPVAWVTRNVAGQPIATLSPVSTGSVPVYAAPPQRQPEQEPVAQAWAEGYRAGIDDERMSEANIGVAGFGAKVEPARNNPYRTATPQRQPEQAQKQEPGAWAWLFRGARVDGNNVVLSTKDNDTARRLCAELLSARKKDFIDGCRSTGMDLS